VFKYTKLVLLRNKLQVDSLASLLWLAIER